MKLCLSTTCDYRDIAQPLNSFSKNKSRKDGLHPVCKVCIKKHKQKYLSNPKAKENQNITLRKYNQSLKGRFLTYKKSAKKRDLKFELTLEQFKEITTMKCYFCNEFSKGKEFCGVDRYNNQLGYEWGNCIACCDVHNFMKKDMDPEDFKQACLKVTKWFMKV